MAAITNGRKRKERIPSLIQSARCFYLYRLLNCIFVLTSRCEIPSHPPFKRVGMPASSHYYYVFVRCLRVNATLKRRRDGWIRFPNVVFPSYARIYSRFKILPYLYQPPLKLNSKLKNSQRVNERRPGRYEV